MGLFFKKREKQPTPPWIKWLLLGFIGYAIIINQNKDGEPRKALDKAAEELHPKKLFGYDSFKSKLFPTMQNDLLIKEVKPGNGEPVGCAQEVRIAYTTSLADGTSLPDQVSADKPLTYRIGEGKVMPVFERAIVGMTPQGKRSVAAQPALTYGAEGFARDDMPRDQEIVFDIELLDAKPTLPAPRDTPYRMFTQRGGNGATISCGMPVTVALTMWDMEGKRLYPKDDTTPTPLTFTPGKSEVFMGLEQGVMGTSPGTQRLLIVPPAMQKTMHGNQPTITIPLPNKQTVLVELEILP
ncbi:MAG: FKBP-type peptidyl-prolyl cis-trans isomerase [Rickettsiales bacterium]|nr:FKBP-type peptidyl-prolyl cis-trans isomerase [Rickettsiales bacterium]